MRPTTGLVMGTGLVKAAARRANLYIVAAIVGSALLLQWWPLLGLAAVAYLIAVSWDLLRRSFWREVIREVRRRPPDMPNDVELTCEESRRFLSRLVSTRAERSDVLQRRARASDLGAGPELLECTVALEERAIGLLRRFDELAAFVTSARSADAAAAEFRLQEQMGGIEDDPEMCAEYAKAQAAVALRRESLSALVRQRDLAASRLEANISALEVLPSHLMYARYSGDGAPPIDSSGGSDGFDDLMAEMSLHPADVSANVRESS